MESNQVGEAPSKSQTIIFREWWRQCWKSVTWGTKLKACEQVSSTGEGFLVSHICSQVRIRSIQQGELVQACKRKGSC